MKRGWITTWIAIAMFLLLTATSILTTSCSNEFETVVGVDESNGFMTASVTKVLVDTYDITFFWTEPTSGSPVDRYVGELETDGGSWITWGYYPENTATLTFEKNKTYRFRVAGIDSLNRQGIFSEASDPVYVSAPVEEILDPIAKYEFDEHEGNILYDTSGYGDPVNLIIESGDYARWGNFLYVRGPSVIRSEVLPTKIVSTIKRTNEFTVAAWVLPILTDQTGPARIISISKDPYNRNFTMGHDVRKVDVRNRTSESDNNGIPSISYKAFGLQAPNLITYTYDNGVAKIYRDKELLIDVSSINDLSRWDETYPLLLANENTGDRPWTGVYYRMLIYAKALTQEEVVDLYRSYTPN